LFTLTDVHKKAEEWMDRASIAVRTTTISYDELEELVNVGESLPLNVSDVLEKLRNRLLTAQEWTSRVEEIVPRSDDYLTWLRRYRQALLDSDKNGRLLSLLSEGSRIPVTMECSTLLQIEIDARHWSGKAKPWIPSNLLDNPSAFGSEGGDDDVGGGDADIGELIMDAPQKRGKIDDVEEHLDRASSLRDRLDHILKDEEERPKWMLEGERQLEYMIKLAETWFEKVSVVRMAVFMVTRILRLTTFAL
jgi:hypothetical protein